MEQIQENADDEAKDATGKDLNFEQPIVTPIRHESSHQIAGDKEQSSIKDDVEEEDDYEDDNDFEPFETSNKNFYLGDSAVDTHRTDSEAKQIAEQQLIQQSKQSERYDTVVGGRNNLKSIKTTQMVTPVQQKPEQ